MCAPAKLQSRSHSGVELTPSPREFSDKDETGKDKRRFQSDVPKVYFDVEDGKRTLRYLRPILITNQVCLQCHIRPEALLPEVKERLQMFYPGVRATGYQLNDLCGAVSIDMPLPEG